jgi:hypothetical protein
LTRAFRHRGQRPYCPGGGRFPCAKRWAPEVLEVRRWGACEALPSHEPAPVPSTAATPRPAVVCRARPRGPVATSTSISRGALIHRLTPPCQEQAPLPVAWLRQPSLQMAPTRGPVGTTLLRLSVCVANPTKLATNRLVPIAIVQVSRRLDLRRLCSLLGATCSSAIGDRCVN